MAKIGIFGQASMYRLGENSRSSPWFLLELSLRRRASVLSDESSRLSEKVLLKREHVETCSVHCSNSRLGEMGSLEQENLSRLSEDL